MSACKHRKNNDMSVCGNVAKPREEHDTHRLYSGWKSSLWSHSRRQNVTAATGEPGAVSTDDDDDDGACIVSVCSRLLECAGGF